MRIRTIKPEFFLHDRLYDLEASLKMPARLAFIGLWCVADREGRFKWEPRQLKAQILPYDKVDFSAVMDGLESCGFVMRYGEHNRYGLIPSFKSHQHVNTREAQSTLPEPTEDDMKRICMHVHARGEGKGKERNGTGKEGEGKEGSAASPDFDACAMILPLTLNTPEFKSSWAEWTKARMLGKEPKTGWETMFTKQLEELSAYGPQTAIAAINKAIASGWTGLFPESIRTNANPGSNRQPHVEPDHTKGW